MRALALLACIGCTSSPASTSAPPPAQRVAARQPDRHDSNIARADYIGPNACGECHPDKLADWSRSLHRVMNARVDEPGAVIGDFRGARVEVAGGDAVMTHEGGAYAMTLQQGARHVRYRITRTIGRRGLQEYVGIEDGQRDEVRLPFAWWPRRGGWVAQSTFDPWLEHFDPFAPVREPWAERCPWCHSTYPFAQRIARAQLRPVGHGLEQYFGGEHGSERLGVDEQVTTGISCESCHLGGRAHAAGQPIHFVPQGAEPRSGAPVPTSFADEWRDPKIVNAVCAQCHSGPSPRLADGTALRNSSEALDLAASPCTGIRCIDCHDPHRADSRADEPRAVAACTRCHAAQADRAHAGAGHATSSCLDCHMPKLVMGIDRYVRTHRISSPTNAKLLADGAPNACNLCHLDRSLAWTVRELRAGWDVKLPPLATDDDDALGTRYLASKSPAIRLIAAHAYARSPLGKYELAAIEKGLADKLAYVRAWTQFAIDDIKARVPR